MEKRGEFAVRQSIIDGCLALARLGVNQGTAGNISVRWNGGLLITPSGLPYDEMGADDIVFMAMDGSFRHPLAPSSEWRFHRDILARRPEVGAVVHAHPIFCTAFAMCRMEIPAAHYMIAAAGGPTIRCARYESYGTPELSEAALEALEGRACTLLANHGMIATGPDLAEALWLAVETETLARQYAAALQIGAPVILDDAEIAKTVEKFKDYGLRGRNRRDG
ncbi:class II aldolase/adducin family protein [Methylocella silvestris BL2]|uniref:Class II aldolase/adducin family protein n=1 Tax=Methylocella silvestris (strain DSM 15510 / CIP 108128 / LMG 27833 / NCIMB 13906 / BL2) TaxID=395965 RepID=B8ENG0_METSB|nr:class II aldolase/adducin family protein [Methylocella silvestris]ACK50091.1 class II aldolase/adducin family protein [Methylocella silvestris BL2]